MYVCRLFHRDRPSEQIDARFIASGALTLGRDPETDWPLDDPEGLLSRMHCTLSMEDGRLLLVDSSTNGTFVNGSERAPRGVPVPLACDQSIRLGAMTIRIDSPAVRGDLEATIIDLPSAVPAETWEEEGTDQSWRSHPDASLLEAFCEGARLDASVFSDEDPEILMRRLGGIYQQTVLGLAAIMAQRTAMKERYELDRTTVSGQGNNPIKWTAPRRLAQALLRRELDGFLPGDEAVRAAFVELADHVAGIAAGANAAIEATLDALSPDALAAATAGQGFSLRGKPAAQVDALRERHAEYSGGAATASFTRAYQAACSSRGG